MARTHSSFLGRRACRMAHVGLTPRISINTPLGRSGAPGPPKLGRPNLGARIEADSKASRTAPAPSPMVLEAAGGAARAAASARAVAEIPPHHRDRASSPPATGPDLVASRDMLGLLVRPRGAEIRQAVRRSSGPAIEGGDCRLCQGGAQPTPVPGSEQGLRDAAQGPRTQADSDAS